MTTKQREKLINAMCQHNMNESGAHVDIMDLSKIYEAGMAAYMGKHDWSEAFRILDEEMAKGEAFEKRVRDATKAIKDTIAKIRKN